MSRIKERFARRKHPLFIGFLVAGDPDFSHSLIAARAMADGGVDVLEIGLPFSDPVADGPAIQHAHERALQAGMTTDRVFALVKAVREQTGIPIVLFSYYNLVFSRGTDRFFADARAAGADGILIVDLPVEEYDDAARAGSRHGIDTILLVAPTTSPERRKRIYARTGGFVYLISLEGVTGARARLPEHVAGLLASVRAETALPVAVGFGISRPGQVRDVCRAGADGVIVGSAFADIIGRHTADEDGLREELMRYIAEMRAALPARGEG
ncbi:MAG: tryptophan synthase subunit alpha [Methanomicrobiales archaeon]|nr:tryptophan synthase subunit alpha [Methanomicrobiales archaeon]